ncbi:MAG: ATP-binding cassette domain-containing protein, partial [Myxococcales bacterium]
MTLWRGSNIQLAYGARTIFDGLDLVVEEGECVGLVGVNGSGKSTLLKIAAGLSKPDAGLIEKRREAVIGYLPQEPRFPEGETIASVLFRAQGRLAEAHAEHQALSKTLETAPAEQHESLLRRLEEAAAKIERLGGWDTTHLAKSMLQRLDVPESEWERPLAQLSGGSQKRVAIAQVLLLRPDLLILDEPTNHLDVQTIDWLESELDAFDGAILLVTHDRYFLDRLAERIVELEHGKLVGYPGNFGDYLGQKLVREEEATKKEHKRQRLSQ